PRIREARRRIKAPPSSAKVWRDIRHLTDFGRRSATASVQRASSGFAPIRAETHTEAPAPVPLAAGPYVERRPAAASGWTTRATGLMRPRTGSAAGALFAAKRDAHGRLDAQSSV